jgi:hypothetical protein
MDRFNIILVNVDHAGNISVKDIKNMIADYPAFSCPAIAAGVYMLIVFLKGDFVGLA